ncbi:YdcF family protein, partial [Caminibacter sp.]
GIFKAMPDAFKREVYGLLLAKKHNLPLIITGGGKLKEALLAKDDLNLFKKICACSVEYIPESRALNTYQNAKYTALLFKKLKLKKEIYLVTSAYHMKRAYILFKKFHFKIITKPVDFKATPVSSGIDFLPSEGAFDLSYTAIHEYLGILRAKLR